MAEPMSDERLAEIRTGWAGGGALNRTGQDVRELLAEVDRLRAALADVRLDRDKAWAEVERRPERDFVSAVISDRDKAEAALARVTELHYEGVQYADDVAEGTDVPDDYERHFCHEDGEDWPCATIRALEGATE